MEFYYTPALMRARFSLLSSAILSHWMPREGGVWEEDDINLQPPLSNTLTRAARAKLMASVATGEGEEEVIDKRGLFLGGEKMRAESRRRNRGRRSVKAQERKRCEHQGRGQREEEEGEMGAEEDAVRSQGRPQGQLSE